MSIDRDRMVAGYFTEGEQTLLRALYEWIGPQGDGANGDSPAANAWRHEVATQATNLDFGAWIGETFIQVLENRVRPPWWPEEKDAPKRLPKELEKLLKETAKATYGINDWMTGWDSTAIAALVKAGYLRTQFSRAQSFGDVDTTSAYLTEAGEEYVKKHRL